MITISWTDQVEVSPDTVCGVQTYTVFDGKEVCEIDIENKQIIIKNIFLGQGDGYNDLIKVSFTDVTNPRTNQELLPISVRTFDDSNQEFAVDLVEYFPLLQCNYPCRFCAPDKDYCYECWDDDPNNYLMAFELISTCKSSCDYGFTTNGDPDLICIQCD